MKKALSYKLGLTILSGISLGGCTRHAQVVYRDQGEVTLRVMTDGDDPGSYAPILARGAAQECGGEYTVLMATRHPPTVLFVDKSRNEYFWVVACEDTETIRI
jgi:hypothetical protein